MLSHKKVDSINLYYPPQAKQLSEIFKVMQIPHKFFIDLIYGRPSKAHYWQKILGFNDGVHFFSELPLYVLVTPPATNSEATKEKSLLPKWEVIDLPNTQTIYQGKLEKKAL